MREGKSPICFEADVNQLKDYDSLHWDHIRKRWEIDRKSDSGPRSMWTVETQP